MRNVSTIPNLSRIGRLAIAASVAALFVVSFGSAAKADDWHRHEVEARGYHRGHPYYGHPVIAQPVYAPPVVVAEPPPPSPGINLVLPLNFR